MANEVVPHQFEGDEGEGGEQGDDDGDDNGNGDHCVRRLSFEELREEFSGYSFAYINTL